MYMDYRLLLLKTLKIVYWEIFLKQKDYHCQLKDKYILLYRYINDYIERLSDSV